MAVLEAKLDRLKEKHEEGKAEIKKLKRRKQVARGRRPALKKKKELAQAQLSDLPEQQRELLEMLFPGITSTNSRSG